MQVIILLSPKWSPDPERLSSKFKTRSAMSFHVTGFPRVPAPLAEVCRDGHRQGPRAGLRAPGRAGGNHLAQPVPEPILLCSLHLHRGTAAWLLHKPAGPRGRRQARGGPGCAGQHLPALCRVPGEACRHSGALRAAPWTGPRAGRAAPTQRLSPPGGPLGPPQRRPFLTASRVAVLAPRALPCGTGLGGCWRPGALPACPSPGPPHPGAPPRGAPPQAQRADPQSNFFSMILSNMPALGCRREARPHAGHSSFPATPARSARSRGHPPQAPPPGDGRPGAAGSPGLAGCMVA